LDCSHPVFCNFPMAIRATSRTSVSASVSRRTRAGTALLAGGPMPARAAAATRRISPSGWVRQPLDQCGHRLDRYRSDLLEGMSGHDSDVPFGRSECLDQRRHDRPGGRSGQPECLPGVVTHIPVRIGERVEERRQRFLRTGPECTELDRITSGEVASGGVG
jgi:hypothetical protein